jgi:Holliday junction DNA helicase RuvA subunit
LAQLTSINTHTSALKVFTTLVVREDAMQLFGFLNKADRQCFELLRTCSGVGPKSALAILSSLSISEITTAILTNTPKVLSSAKGVGPKLAEKIALELRDKLKRYAVQLSQLEQESVALHTKPLTTETIPADKNSPAQASLKAGQTKSSTTQPPSSPYAAEVQSVLLSLGYDFMEIQRALGQFNATHPASNSASTLLEQCLKLLAQQALT